ncbi:MAG: Holliday junction resolvase RuvX [Anaerolineae bacterium]|nr:Holliday junction resolvase RuvX [Anaerolineae bacterium]
MRFLGIDHGTKRIGLAVSDASGLIARELTILKRASKTEDFARLGQIIRQEHIEAIIVGAPTNYEAHPGQYSQADTVKNWVALLAETTPLPIVLWDEQLSSADARELARSKRRKPTDPIDDLAARVILQSYLDALRDGLADLPAL